MHFSLAVTDATPQNPPNVAIMAMCPAYLGSRETSNSLYSKELGYVSV
jgi:hypothetical protein